MIPRLANPRPSRRGLSLLGPSLLAGVAAALLSLLTPDLASAASAIKVLVNAEPITSTDVAARTKLLRLISGGKAGEKQAIEELVEEKLKLSEAAKRKITANEEEVERAYAAVAERAKLTPALLSTALRQNGVDPGELKDRIRAELTWGNVIRARFRATVRVSDVEVAKAIAKKKSGGAKEGDKPLSYDLINELELQQIIFIVPEKTRAKGTPARLREAAAFRSAFAGCAKSVEQARGYKGVVVKPRFRRLETEMPQDLKDELVKVEIGTTIAPKPSPLGVELIAVCNRRPVEGQTVASVEVKSELQNEQGQLMARRYMRDLRADAIIEYR